MDAQNAHSIRRGLLIGLALVAVAVPPGIVSSLTRWPVAQVTPAALTPLPEPAGAGVHFAEFGSESASADVRLVADWVADSRDNQGADFILVDKKHAAVYVFDAQARLRGATPVLLGVAPGDDSVPGIGMRPIADVAPHERTTPAGRFIAERGRNATGEDVVWIDYDAAVSMHRVRTGEPRERRLERLATPSIADNRISYGCINVPVAFYEALIRPTFAHQPAVVYVLPETRPVHQVFGVYDARTTRTARRS